MKALERENRELRQANEILRKASACLAMAELVLWNPWLLTQSGAAAQHRKLLGDGGGIHPVVMRGTYDDHNWQVLKARWTELRAQLHGEVLPPDRRRAERNPGLQMLIDQVVAATPTFSPLRQDNS